jgi:hypothetical protein
MKADVEHFIPLNEPALAILSGVERGEPDEKVFDVTPEAVWRLMRELCAGLTVHGLRRHQGAAVNAAKAGVGAWGQDIGEDTFWVEQ